MMIGEDQRILLPASALTGALIMSSSSILAKIVAPGIMLPIGIVISAIGLPVFLYLDPEERKRDMVVLSSHRLGVRDGSRQVLRDVSLAPCHGGEVLAVIGPNAAGPKTSPQGPCRIVLVGQADDRR